MIRFAEEYITEVQKDQKKRAEGEENQSMKVFRELRTPTEKQVRLLAHSIVLLLCRVWSFDVVIVLPLLSGVHVCMKQNASS